MLVPSGIPNLPPAANSEPGMSTRRLSRARTQRRAWASWRPLAKFEHLPGPDEPAAQRLLPHGFGERPYFEALVAETEADADADADAAIAGFALYFMTYSTFLARATLYLEDLFVRPEHPARASRQLSCAAWQRSPSSAIAVASSGRSWIGT